MRTVYGDILHGIAEGDKQLAILIDPDKMQIDEVKSFIEQVNMGPTTHIFVGGSEVESGITEDIIKEIRRYTALPVVLFPGDENQLTDTADAVLFLSLISGRNPKYLIEKHIQAVPKLNRMGLEVIPTGYILIENGKQTAVERISQTKPLSRHNIERIQHTAQAGEYLGMKLIYLEAGSGALHPIDTAIISAVKKHIRLPLIVGGGIRSIRALESAYNAGADMVVIGNAFEKQSGFFKQITRIKHC
jgi:phosphoglycerol geranylgeranyltransferase